MTLTEGHRTTGPQPFRTTTWTTALAPLALPLFRTMTRIQILTASHHQRPGQRTTIHQTCQVLLQAHHEDEDAGEDGTASSDEKMEEGVAVATGITTTAVEAGAADVVVEAATNGTHLVAGLADQDRPLDRKSTRLNSSHSGESRMPSSA